jgi:hypothetical protein
METGFLRAVQIVLIILTTIALIGCDSPGVPAIDYPAKAVPGQEATLFALALLARTGMNIAP